MKALTCHVCEEHGRYTALDPSDRTVLHEVIGYSRDRTAGGQNHVRFRRLTGRAMCGDCAARLQYAGSARQEALL